MLEVSANVQRVLVPVPAGTFANLRVRTDVTNFVGTTVTVTVNVNGTDTGMTCSITGVANTCQDTVNTAAVVAGGAVALRLEQTGIAVPTRIIYSVQLLP